MTRFLTISLLALTPNLVLAQDTTGEKLEQAERLLNNPAVKLALQNRGGFSSVEVLVPLAFFLFIFGVVFVAFYWRYRQTKELQTSIRLMVEKGAQIPLELIVPKERSSYLTDIRRGLVLVSVGCVLPFAIGASDPTGQGWVWGLIPLALGIAYLFSAKISKRSDRNG